MSHRLLQRVASCASLLVLAALAHGSDSWPTFRGPQRTGVAPDKGLLTEWPEGGPKLVWKTAGAGRGYSSLAIVDGKIFTLGDAPSTADDKDEFLVCFNQADGKQLWKTKTGPAYNEGQPNWQSFAQHTHRRWRSRLCPHSARRAVLLQNVRRRTLEARPEKGIRR